MTANKRAVMTTNKRDGMTPNACDAMTAQKRDAMHTKHDAMMRNVMCVKISQPKVLLLQRRRKRGKQPAWIRTEPTL